MYEECNGAEKYYFYDSNGVISGIRHFDAEGTMTMIYVITNALGDVIALYDKNGNAVVEYQYDAWGNIISTTNGDGSTLSGIGITWNEINPFRYRGYYWDSETELYYLQSRYYDAETGRFINADVLVSDIGGELVGYNTFAYCFNNPINMVDVVGCWPSWNDFKVWVNDAVNDACEFVNNVIDKGKEVYDAINEAYFVNFEYGYGIGGEFETPYASVSATANANPFCFKITNDEIKLYSSLNLSLTYNYEGFEIGPELRVEFDWKKFKFDVSYEESPRISDLEYSYSRYSGKGFLLSYGLE